MEELSKQLYTHLYQSIKILDEIILDLKGNRREYKSDYVKNLEATKKELEYIFTNLRTVLKPEHKNLFRRTLREVVYEDVHKGFRLEPTGYDPELNKYSSRVIQMPMTRLLGQLKEAIFDSEKVIKQYPDHPELQLIKKDLQALHKEVLKFAEEKGLE